MEFLPESDMASLNGCNTLLCEGQEFELLKEDQIDGIKGNMCVRQFADAIIAEQFMSVITKHIRFKI